MAIYPRKILCELASYILEDIHTPGKNNKQIDEKKKQMKDLAFNAAQNPIIESFQIPTGYTKTMNPGQNIEETVQALYSFIDRIHTDVDDHHTGSGLHTEYQILTRAILDKTDLKNSLVDLQNNQKSPTNVAFTAGKALTLILDRGKRL